MADTHEEQLLTDLLETIAREDSKLEAPHIEARVIESVSLHLQERRRRSRAWVVLPVAAAVVIAFVITARLKPLVRLKPDTTTVVRLKPDTTQNATVQLKPDTMTDRTRDTTEIAIAESPSRLRAETPNASAGRLIASQEPKPARPTVRSVRLQPDPGLQPDRRPEPNLPTQPNQQSPTESPIVQSPIEFVPLLPMTAQELTGSFQIVRVQMPGASLGALRPPLARPNEIVEADVLLGEDGRARAIRLNTNGSIYPWRSR
jgi:hypothetical protein